jgi:hypothetical protein
VCFVPDHEIGTCADSGGDCGSLSASSIFTDILDPIYLFHDRRSFVPVAHKYCRGEGEALKVSVNCTFVIADSTVASAERDGRQTAGKGAGIAQ